MMGIKSVAEFVENEQIFKKLKALGLNEFQGYYFSKPQPLEHWKNSL
jgi:EAL domain-containing protein (putative c-di-GMP-specific phosphodiesterase class I)